MVSLSFPPPWFRGGYHDKTENVSDVCLAFVRARPLGRDGCAMVGPFPTVVVVSRRVQSDRSCICTYSKYISLADMTVGYSIISSWCESSCCSVLCRLPRFSLLYPRPYTVLNFVIHVEFCLVSGDGSVLPHAQPLRLEPLLLVHRGSAQTRHPTQHQHRRCCHGVPRRGGVWRPRRIPRSLATLTGETRTPPLFIFLFWALQLGRIFARDVCMDAAV